MWSNRQDPQRGARSDPPRGWGEKWISFAVGVVLAAMLLTLVALITSLGAVP